MTRERVRDGAILQRFVDEGRVPADSQEHARAANILSQGAYWESSNLLQGFATDNIARPGTPGNTHGVFDWLGDVNKGVQALG